MPCIRSISSCYGGCGPQENEFVDVAIQQRFAQIQTRALELRDLPTYTEVEEQLTAIETEIAQAVNAPEHRREFQSKRSGYYQLHQDVKAACTQIHNYLNENSDKLKAEQKWIDLGFSREWLQADPEAVHFLGRTGAILSAVTLQNSASLQHPQPLLSFDDGKISVLVKEDEESEYVPVHQFQARVRYDERDDMFVDNTNNHGWNMTQWGFIPKGRFEGFEPFAQITPAALDQVVEHGKTFWSPEQQRDRNGNERTCVIQLTTSYKPRMGLPRSGLTQNAIETFNHIGMRIIDQNGKVYSTGYEMTAANNAATFGSPRTFLGTANAKGAWPDFDDVRPFDERHVTTIAISEEEFRQVKQFVEETKDARFNAVKQNCAKHVSEAFKKVGVEIPVFQDCYDYFANALPSLDQIPVVGKPLSWVVKAISTVANAIFKFISWITPEFIKFPFRVVWEGIKTVHANLWMLILGANKMTPRDPTDPRSQEDVIDNTRMSSFSRMFRNWKDIFNPELRQFASSRKVMDWQRAQNTNVIHPSGNGSRLCIVPPQAA